MIRDGMIRDGVIRDGVIRDGGHRLARGDVGAIIGAWTQAQVDR